ncbi:acyl-coenzyme A thioesterase THEM4-like [Amphiura filiformis]|uniref:acyl-coenzyme A thioesterase THEM4-like n=1 Tax=Amphiura filiformis TaxID=82378 RepID=UPI003B20D1E9
MARRLQCIKSHLLQHHIASTNTAHPRCHFTRTHLHKQMQTKLLSSSTRRVRMSSSANFPTNAVDLDPTTTESGWLPKTEEICAKFQARVNAGELTLMRSTKTTLNHVLYSMSHPQKGAHFEYALFYEETNQKGYGVIQFGPQTQGPPGIHVWNKATLVAQPGKSIDITTKLEVNKSVRSWRATATMFDVMTAVYVDKGLKKTCMTANLNMNFKRPIPLNSTVLAETWVEKIEGRKLFLGCEKKSTDGQVLIEGTALFITVKAILL